MKCMKMGSEVYVMFCRLGVSGALCGISGWSVSVERDDARK